MEAAVDEIAVDESEVRGDYDTYRKVTVSIKNYPVLTEEQERDICAMLLQGSEWARIKLFNHNLRLIPYVINTKFRTKALTGFLPEDLFQAAAEYLWRATSTFDPTKEIRFVTYAIRTLETGLLNVFAEDGHLIRRPHKVEAAVNKMLRVCYLHDLQPTEKNKLINLIIEKYSNEPPFSVLSCEKTLRKHLEVIYSVMTSSHCSLDIEETNYGHAAMDNMLMEIEDSVYVENIPKPDQLINHQKLSKILHEALSEYDERERVIIALNFGLGGGEPKSFVEIQSILAIMGYTLSRQRIKQIVDTTLVKLRSTLRKKVTNHEQYNVNIRSFL